MAEGRASAIPRAGNTGPDTIAAAAAKSGMRRQMIKLIRIEVIFENNEFVVRTRGECCGRMRTHTLDSGFVQTLLSYPGKEAVEKFAAKYPTKLPMLTAAEKETA